VHSVVQHSAFVVHVAPMGTHVTSGGVHFPATQLVVQQSESAVQVPVSGMHVDPQRKTPAESGTQIFPQHSSGVVQP
jgi:hypothetical protein